MNVLEHQTNRIPILITLTGAGPTGLTPTGLTISMVDGLGTVEAWTSGDYTLTEVDAISYPGRYVITDYPKVDIVATYLTKNAGVGQLRIYGASIDTQILEVEVSEALRHARETHRAAYQRLEWNADESRWDLYDENDALFGYFTAQDANGSESVIDGTHPVTRLAFTAI
jgi:hypothetical protein